MHKRELYSHQADLDDRSSIPLQRRSLAIFNAPFHGGSHQALRTLTQIITAIRMLRVLTREPVAPRMHLTIAYTVNHQIDNQCSEPTN